MAPAMSAAPSSTFRHVRAILAWVGRQTRRRLRFLLSLMAMVLGILLETARPRSWRRPSRGEFRRILRLALLGSLPATIFVAAVLGLGIVYQALYWLRVAGQEGSTGTILVTVLLREVVPLMVGVILLGRSGSALLTELGQLHRDNQIHALTIQGVDPFQLLVLPRATALALTAYVLGIIFIMVTLLVGFAVASLLGAIQYSVWSFLDDILRATTPRDFIIFPVKMLMIGLMVAATTSLTALSAGPDERIGPLMARGFVRGMLAVMLTSGFLSLAA